MRSIAVSSGFGRSSRSERRLPEAASLFVVSPRECIPSGSEWIDGVPARQTCRPRNARTARKLPKWGGALAQRKSNWSNRVVRWEKSR